MTKRTITVDADALHQVLQALMGPAHHIRELQATRGLPQVFGDEHANPIDTLVANYKAAPADSPAIVWPQARDVGRIGDMSPSASLRVGLDNDNDVYLSVWGEDGGGSVEFCNGGGGGGHSMRTRLALIALMVAMEADNAERPDRDWWARRRGASKASSSDAEPAAVCTCPSGDGSLRWPCAVHPPSAGTSEGGSAA